MVTMLDCIRREPSLLLAIVQRRAQTFEALWGTYDPAGVRELCLIGSGSSHTAAVTARFAAEKMSGVRVSVLLPDEFLYAHSVYPKDALYVFISQTGTSSVLLEAMELAKARGLMTAAVSEKAETPAARQAGAFIDMGCGREEYGIRTIGYSTTVMTLMMLGLTLGQARGALTDEEAGAYLSQAQAGIDNIPAVIEAALHWMDTSRRKIMRSRFIAFTGMGALYGVAQEGAVKLWEAPQYPSGGYELDEGMHGPNYGYTDADAVIVLNDGAPGSERGLDLARYMKCEHENGYIFGLQTQDDKDLAFTPMGGPFGCLEFAAAVQVFMYRFAVDGGRDFSVLGIHKKMNSYFDAHKRREEKRP